MGTRFGICLLAFSCYAWAQVPGTITTVAGTGSGGYGGDNGPATSGATL